MESRIIPLDIVIAVSKALGNWDGTPEQAAEKLGAAVKAVQDFAIKQEIGDNQSRKEYEDSVTAWIKKARGAATHVVLLIEDTGNAGVSPSPTQRADWQATCLMAYAAMSFANDADQALDSVKQIKKKERAACLAAAIEALDLIDRSALCLGEEIDTVYGKMQPPQMQREKAVAIMHEAFAKDRE